MKTRRSGLLRKSVAVSLAAALIGAAPGSGTYEALAAVGVAPVKVAVPVGGMSAAGAGAAGSVSAGQFFRLDIPQHAPAVSLQGTFSPTPGAPTPANASPLALPASVLAPSAQAGLFGAAPLARPGGGASPVMGRSFPAIPRRSIEDVSPALDVIDANPAGDFGRDSPEFSRSMGSRSNRLGRMFRELRRAFAMGSESEHAPARSELDSPSGSATLRAQALPAVSGKPILRSTPGLRPYAAPLEREDAASRAPVPLDLRGRRFAADMEVRVEPVSRATSLRQVTGEDGGLLRPEDFGFETAKVVAENIQAAGRAEKGKSWFWRGVDGIFERLLENFGSSDIFKKAGAQEKPSGWFGLGKVAMMLIASLVVAQVGVESLGAAMPSLIQKTFGDFTAVAQLAIVASVASIVGRQIGPVVVKRLGLKNTYLAAEGARLLSVSLLAGLLATGNMTLLLMGVFYAVNGMLAGVSMTALESIPPAIVGRDPARLEKFWTWEQTILETVAIVTPILTGSVVASMGFLPALIAFPVAMAASLAIVFFTLRLPKRFEQLREAELSLKSSSPRRNFFAKLLYGARLVWNNKALRYSFLAYTFYVLINPFLYTMLAPAFGLRLMPTPELAASVQGWLTGLYSMGGLLGGFLMMLEQWRGKKKSAAMRAEAEAKRGKISDKDWEKEITPWRNERLRKSMLTWLLIGTAGLSMLVPLAFPMATLGQTVVLPAFLSWASGLTVQAGALVFFGIAQVISVLKLRSFFQSRVPQTDERGREIDNMPDAMGFFGSASLLVSTAGLLGLKTLFQNVAGFAPFLYIAWGLLPLGALYLFLRWRLSSNSR